MHQQTEIGITPWVTSYNEAIMPQPDKFRPERWLQATKEERVLMGTYHKMLHEASTRKPPSLSVGYPSQP